MDVINERGQVLGRMAFEVVQTGSPPELTTIVF
ncbi:hypothetical protein KJ853_01885 [Patescibacteria group bacterium]|nr:hypothetical protein [Patescibacteria group bacterium]